MTAGQPLLLNKVASVTPQTFNSLYFNPNLAPKPFRDFVVEWEPRKKWIPYPSASESKNHPANPKVNQLNNWFFQDDPNQPNPCGPPIEVTDLKLDGYPFTQYSLSVCLRKFVPMNWFTTYFPGVPVPTPIPSPS